MRYGTIESNVQRVTKIGIEFLHKRSLPVNRSFLTLCMNDNIVRRVLTVINFSVQPLCSLCLCGYLAEFHHRDTESTEVAQRRDPNTDYFAIARMRFNFLLRDSLA